MGCCFFKRIFLLVAKTLFSGINEESIVVVESMFLESGGELGVESELAVDFFSCCNSDRGTSSVDDRLK